MVIGDLQFHHFVGACRTEKGLSPRALMLDFAVSRTHTSAQRTGARRVDQQAVAVIAARRSAW